MVHQNYKERITLKELLKTIYSLILNETLNEKGSNNSKIDIKMTLQTAEFLYDRDRWKEACYNYSLLINEYQSNNKEISAVQYGKMLYELGECQNSLGKFNEASQNIEKSLSILK